MAYITKEQTSEKRKKIAEVNKRYGMKTYLRREHHQCLELTIVKGPIDFGTKYESINVYHLNNRDLPKKAFEYITEVKDILYEGNHDNSDAQYDYFDVGWYVRMTIGNWEREYTYTGE